MATFHGVGTGFWDWLYARGVPGSVLGGVVDAVVG